MIYTITYIDYAGIVRRIQNVQANSIQRALNTFFEHFPLDTNVTCIQQVFRMEES
jgi:hypothetical protein